MTKQSLLLMSCAAVLLTACGGGGSQGPTVTEFVPAAASTDSVAATNYVAALTAVPASTTDTLEPVAVPDTLASSDTDEPAVIP